MSYQAPAPGATPAPAMPPPVADPYAETADLNQLLTPEQREQYKQHTLDSFPTWAAVVLHIVTLGLFTTVYQLLKHGQLPKVKPTDPSAGKAIGFSFIPFFNLYWMFPAWLGLVDRINFQFRLRGRPAPISRGMVLATLICWLVGFVIGITWLVSLILSFILLVQTQNATNELVAELVPAPLGAPTLGTTP